MDIPSKPLVTIITAVKNMANELEETIKSIKVLDYPNLEFIVIDGGSTDRTLDVIHSNSAFINNFVSEPDEGISDAFNKGVNLASGHYINFQGAGDTFVNPGVISKMMDGVNKDKDILISGKVLRVSETKKPLWVAPKKYKPNFNKSQLLFKMPLPHQALFMHNSFYQQYGLFDKNIKFAMDYELLLRAYNNFPRTVLKDIVVSSWRAGGVGKDRIDEIYDEYHKIKMIHKVAPKSLLIAIDKYNRGKYFIKKLLHRGKDGV